MELPAFFLVKFEEFEAREATQLAGRLEER